MVSSIAALMWESWRGRNLMLFEDETPHAVMLAAGFMKYVHDYSVYAARVMQNAPIGGTGSSPTIATSGVRLVAGRIKA